MLIILIDSLKPKSALSFRRAIAREVLDAPMLTDRKSSGSLKTLKALLIRLRPATTSKKDSAIRRSRTVTMHMEKRTCDVSRLKTIAYNEPSIPIKMIAVDQTNASYPLTLLTPTSLDQAKMIKIIIVAHLKAIKPA